MSTEIEEELERGTRLRGFRYGSHDFEAYLNGVESLRKHNDHVEASYLKKGHLDRKSKELAIVAVCVALKDAIPHIKTHMHVAQKAGATPEEIMELLNLVGNWTGTVAKMVGLEAWRQTFRPDLPEIPRIVELR